jgi:hypothetical protein
MIEEKSMHMGASFGIWNGIAGSWCSVQPEQLQATYLGLELRRSELLFHLQLPFTVHRSPFTPKSPPSFQSLNGTEQNPKIVNFSLIPNRVSTSPKTETHSLAY